MKFKIGDIVRVKEGVSIIRIEVGDICEVIQIDDNGLDYPYKVERKSDGKTEWFKEEHLESLKLTLETLQVGDEIVNEDSVHRKILAICAKGVYIISSFYEKGKEGNEVKKFGGTCTAYDLGEMGYTPVQPENTDEIIELTIDEIAEKFGVDAKKVKIKK